MNYEKRNQVLDMGETVKSPFKALMDHLLAEGTDLAAPLPVETEAELRTGFARLLEAMRIIEGVPNLLSTGDRKLFERIRARFSNPLLFDEVLSNLMESDAPEVCANLILSEVFTLLPMGISDRSDAFQQVVQELRFPVGKRFLEGADFARLQEIAKIEPEARDFAQIWIAHHLRMKGPISEEMAELIIYLLETDRPNKPRGPRKSKKVIRNEVIKGLALYLHLRFGLYLERNEASVHHQSAASVISEALGKFRESVTEVPLGRIVRGPWRTDLGRIVDLILRKTMSTT